MTEEQYKAERERFPHGLVLFHDNLMAEGLYSPEKHDDFPPAILAIDSELSDIHKEISLYHAYCFDCQVVCSTGQKNICFVTKDRVKLERKADELEARMKNMILWYRMQTV